MKHSEQLSLVLQWEEHRPVIGLIGFLDSNMAKLWLKIVSVQVAPTQAIHMETRRIRMVIGFLYGTCQWSLMEDLIFNIKLSSFSTTVPAGQHECMIHTINCMYSKIASWRWLACLFETCRGCYQNKINESASRWFCYTTYSLMEDFGVWWICMKKFVPKLLTSEQQKEQIFDAENIAVVLTHLIWSLVIYSCFQEWNCWYEDAICRMSENQAQSLTLLCSIPKSHFQWCFL